MLHIKDLTYRIEGRRLFDQASVAIPAGHKVALVGRNGTGKTTLLRLIDGGLEPDSGSVTLNPGARVGGVAQFMPEGDTPPIQLVLDADEERTRLLGALERESDPEDVATLHERFADIGGHSAPSRAATILAGLGFDEAAQNRPINAFSGGWRMRVALAAALFAAPELLLLDEPTNHLDLEATVWLEQFLAKWPGTLLLVSHDRMLINRVADRTLSLERSKLTLYKGGFDSFRRQRSEQLVLDQKLSAKREAKRQHMQAYVDRFRFKATKARQAQSRLKALEKLDIPIAVNDDPDIRFSFPEPESLAPPIITLEDAAVGYDDRPVLTRLNLRVDMDDRIALVGANGNGKSTLTRLLAGVMEPMQGTRLASPGLRVGYFAQNQTEILIPEQDCLAHMAQRVPDQTNEQHRSHLGRFGLSGSLAESLAGTLSGGERVRLLLALMALPRPHVLMLDEPTNHLDIDSREALVDAINNFPGAVILITHDRNLVELCADRLWLVADGGCRSFDGDLEAYSLSQASGAGTGIEHSRQKGTSEKKNGRKSERRDAAQRREKAAPLRKALRQAEARIDLLTEKKSALETVLADSALYEKEPDKITKTTRELSEVVRALEQAEAKWLEAVEAMEAFDSSMS